MSQVEFYPTADNNAVKYAVIVARYQGKWVFCRHRDRSTWEIPGGHREPGETPEQAARRELWEETGALEADIRPVCYYFYSKLGMLYQADIQKLGPLPETSEIAEIRLFDTLPDDLTYPHIQPYLFDRVQAWLNIQSNAGELWDIYDAHRNLTGRTHRRGDPLAEGDYHLVVHVWLQNSTGEFLLTKRSPNKGYPNMWETTGGSALAGDDSLTAALREVREETGLILLPENGKCIITDQRSDNIVDIWLFRQDFDLKNVVLQEGETCDAMYASREDLLNLREQGKLVPFRYLDKLLAML